jgi:hypothetical protein
MSPVSGFAPDLILARLVVRTTPSKKFRNYGPCQMHGGISTGVSIFDLGAPPLCRPPPILNPPCAQQRSTSPAAPPSHRPIRPKRAAIPAFSRETRQRDLARAESREIVGVLERGLVSISLSPWFAGERLPQRCQPVERGSRQRTFLDRGERILELLSRCHTNQDGAHRRMRERKPRGSFGET